MPTFNFSCGCGHDFEGFCLPSTAEAGIECPQCGHTAKKQFTPGASSYIPLHMADANIAATNRHREWLKTPEAKAQHLELVKDDD